MRLKGKTVDDPAQSIRHYRRREKERATSMRLLLLGLLLATTVAHADVTGKVVAVTDGDTIRVLDASKVEHRVRLSGIDAPERGQPFGTASRDNLARMVAGKHVFVESSKTDRYGRTIGKVLLDGKDVNLEQVRDGYAWWYRYYKDEQSRADRRTYEDAEDTAKRERRGLWADANPINPYEWRKRSRK